MASEQDWFDFDEWAMKHSCPKEFDLIIRTLKVKAPISPVEYDEAYAEEVHEFLLTAITELQITFRHSFPNLRLEMNS